jgi:hypothetical protein
MKVGETVSLELEETKYSFTNLIIYSNPDKALINGDIIQARIPEDWAILIQAIHAGYGDIVVPARNRSMSDFHVSIVIN